MTDLLSTVNIFTDGACSHNPGPGGWAALLISRDTARFISGYQPETTNNRMELLAAISALKALARSTRVTIHTDSRYLADGIERWVHSWRRNNWLTASNKPVVSKDLWMELLELVAEHDVHWTWIRGHADNRFNNFVDQLARDAISNKSGVNEKVSLGDLEAIIVADKFRGNVRQLESAVAATGITGNWRTESDGSYRYDAVNQGILRWWRSTGSLSFQGPDPGRAKLKTAVMTALANGEGLKRLVKRERADKRIFIVHGHDIRAVEKLELALRRLGLHPYLLVKDAGMGETLIEELEGRVRKEGSVGFGIVVMMPDDIGHAAQDGAKKARNRARQSVVLEMGMMIAALTRKNVAILCHVSVEQPTDADWIQYISFDKDIGECTPQLAQRLVSSGFEIDPKRLAAV